MCVSTAAHGWGLCAGTGGGAGRLGTPGQPQGEAVGQPAGPAGGDGAHRRRAAAHCAGLRSQARFHPSRCLRSCTCYDGSGLLGQMQGFVSPNNEAAWLPVVVTTTVMMSAHVDKAASMCIYITTAGNGRRMCMTPHKLRPRYSHKTGCITLTTERHAHREDNRKELLKQLHDLIAEGHRAYPAEPRPDLGLAWDAEGRRIELEPEGGYASGPGGREVSDAHPAHPIFQTLGPTWHPEGWLGAWLGTLRSAEGGYVSLSGRLGRAAAGQFFI